MLQRDRKYFAAELPCSKHHLSAQQHCLPHKLRANPSLCDPVMRQINRGPRTSRPSRSWASHWPARCPTLPTRCRPPRLARARRACRAGCAPSWRLRTASRAPSHDMVAIALSRQAKEILHNEDPNHSRPFLRVATTQTCAKLLQHSTMQEPTIPRSVMVCCSSAGLPQRSMPRRPIHCRSQCH